MGSNNKVLAARRTAQLGQLISYELPLSLAVAAPLLLAIRSACGDRAGSERFYWSLIPKWNILQLPGAQLVSFVVFLIAGSPDQPRPFDLPEAETELVAGFHTSQSMKFAAFFMPNTPTYHSRFHDAILFLGGWLPPFPPRSARISWRLRCSLRRGDQPV